MKRTRVLVGVVPEILGEILCEVMRSEPGLEIVRGNNNSRWSPIEAILESGPPDLVVTMIDNGVPEAYKDLFSVNPGMRLLGLKAHGRDAFLVELQPQSVSLGELSTRDLVDAIRDLAFRPDFESSLMEM